MKMGMTFRKIMIMKKRNLLSLALMGASLGFIACQRDDFSELAGDKAIPNLSSGTLDIDSLRRAGADPRLPHVLPVSLTASYSQEELRAMGFELVDRPGTDFEGNAYNGEYYPRLRILQDTVEVNGVKTLRPPIVPVYLTMVKLDASGVPLPNSVHSQPVNFELIGEWEDTTILPDYSTGERSTFVDDNGREQVNPRRHPDRQVSRLKRNSSERYTIRYNGTVTLPDAYTTFGTDQDNWYVMGIINGYNPKYGSNASVSAGDVFEYSPDSDFDNAINMPGVPFASNWVKLHIERSGNVAMGYNVRRNQQGQTVKGEAMIFKPQGILLQMEAPGNIYMDTYSKYNQIVSNVLQFNVTYDFSPSAVVQAFVNRDMTTGEGLPVFESPLVTNRVTNFSGYNGSNAKLYTINDANYPLSSADRAFPWDMPSVDHATESPTKGAYSTIANLSQGDGADVQSGLFYQILSPMKKSFGQVAWNGAVIGGRNYNTRRVLWMWAMPRKTKPASPYTYIYSSAYSAGGITASQYRFRDWAGSFDLDAYYALRSEYLAIGSELESIDQAIANYQRTINSSEASDADKAYATQQKNLLTAQRVTYASSMSSKTSIYNQQKAIFDQISRGFLAYQNITGQPAVPLYQSNNAFRASATSNAPLNGKVVHLNSLITPDLIFTEVVHREANGENFSVIEIQNPTRQFVSIKNYAVVRLRPGTDGFKFLKKDGTLTDKLTEAMILPLEALRDGSTDPLRASGFDQSFSSGNVGAFSDAQKSYIGYGGSDFSGGITVMQTLRVDPYKGFNLSYKPGRIFENNLPDPYVVSPGKVLLLGASGFVKQPITRRVKSQYFDWYYYQELSGATPAIRSELKSQLGGGSTTGPLALRTHDGMVAYADAGLSAVNGASTLDMQAGDGFALIKQTASGAWQIIDATAPIGAHGYAFAGTFSDYQAQMAGFSSSSSYAMRRDPYVQFPFIFPFRTKRLSSAWSDDWTITTSDVYNNLGIRDRYAYYNWAKETWENNRLDIDGFLLKRTPWDTNTAWITRYKAGRPHQQ